MFNLGMSNTRVTRKMTQRDVIRHIARAASHGVSRAQLSDTFYLRNENGTDVGTVVVYWQGRRGEYVDVEHARRNDERTTSLDVIVGWLTR